jgi:hypothetical protein
MDKTLQVLSRNILHGDEGQALSPAQVKHAADVAVADLSGEFQFVRESLDRFLIQGDLRTQQLEGDLLIDVSVLDFVNLAHAAVAELLDDLVAASEGGTGGELADWRLENFRHDSRMVLRRRQLGAASSTESRCLGIVGKAGRAVVGQASSSIRAWPQTNRGTGGKSNLACLGGFGSPTFGSRVRKVLNAGNICGASERDRTSGWRHLGELCRAALRALNRYFEVAAGEPLGPGVIALINRNRFM